MISPQFRPLAVRDRTAARMLDLPTSEFRNLVAQGALPPPIQIAQHRLWRVDQIEAIVNGDAALPNQDLEL